MRLLGNQMFTCWGEDSMIWREMKLCCPISWFATRAMEWMVFWLLALAQGQAADSPPSRPPFTLRGYYLTLMRMPVMGLPEWKQAVDCFAEDEANVIILWMAGGFRSKKFPVTWGHNQDHANVRQDFVRELIDHAHAKGLRVLLGFTPFGYDGVNRLGIEFPELKARQKDGVPVSAFGIHCWGWNLCPAKPEAQRLMREYLREMVFDFYPNADGLLVESSDYGICHCPECGPRHYDHEFAFVRDFSQEVWGRHTNALILVYPHYFTGSKVPGLDAVASHQPFDSRWGLFFTPHSAHFDARLIAQARTSVFWTDAAALGTPQRVAEAARTARRQGVTGFVPSFEAFSYTIRGPDFGAAWGEGNPLWPFGLDPAGEGRMPYRSVMARIQRLAVREFGRNPDLAWSAFEAQIGPDFFGQSNRPQAVLDLLEFQRIWTHESDWCWSSPLLNPGFFQRRAAAQQWPEEKRAGYRRNLDRLREIAQRYSDASEPVGRELSQRARLVVERWGDRVP